MILRTDKSKMADAVSLALRLWSGHSEKELTEELSPLAKGENGCIFIEYAEEKPIGFAQCQIRNDYVEGSSSSPTAYLEGIYVEPAHRKQGVAKRLVESCEKWAKEKGCMEMGSDCSIENHLSQSFHKSCGFEEKAKIVCFLKKL